MILYRLVGTLYLLSGIWCLIKPELAAAYVGFSWASSSAMAEFVAVYGGLQIGIALAVLYTSRDSRLATAGFIYTLILSISLLSARLFGLWQYGSNAALITMLLVELFIVMILIWGLRTIGKSAERH